MVKKIALSVLFLLTAISPEIVLFLSWNFAGKVMAFALAFIVLITIVGIFLEKIWAYIIGFVLSLSFSIFVVGIMGSLLSHSDEGLAGGFAYLFFVFLLPLAVMLFIGSLGLALEFRKRWKGAHKMPIT